MRRWLMVHWLVAGSALGCVDIDSRHVTATNPSGASGTTGSGGNTSGAGGGTSGSTALGGVAGMLQTAGKSGGGASGVGNGGSGGITNACGTLQEQTPSVCQAPLVATPPLAGEMVDDMEDADNAIMAAHGRSGYWYVFDDATGTTSPAPLDPTLPELISPARGASLYAMHFVGPGHTGYGAGLGMPFHEQLCYDISQITKLQFWAKGPGRIRVNVVTVQTQSEANGGDCLSSDTCCSDHFGIEFELGSDWMLYSIPSSAGVLTQQGYGGVTTYHPNAVINLIFQPAPGHTTSWDFWIDDVMLVGS
ncbi:MAG TPA: hypothetical protein VGP93_18215 [Polyangiaceae bacterium]|nr:hypothetical protein [Polyangiaceae bacterium]